MNNKNKIILISGLTLIGILLLLMIVIPDDRIHMPYKEFKDKTLSGDVITASVNSKEVVFNLKNKSRRLLYRKSR